MTFAQDAHPEQGSFFRSDHFPLPESACLQSASEAAWITSKAQRLRAKNFDEFNKIIITNLQMSFVKIGGLTALCKWSKYLLPSGLKWQTRRQCRAITQATNSRVAQPNRK
jgi:hypothetical protein